MRVVSNTKLAIATLAMLGAGAVALATVPLNSNSSYGFSGCYDADNSAYGYGYNNSFNQNQLFTKAITKYNAGSKTDYCYTFPSTGKTYLMEGACNAAGSFITWQKNCAELNLGKTGVNYQCVDGACVKVISVPQTTLTVTKNSASPNQAVKGINVLLSKFNLTASAAEGVGINQIKFIVAPSSNLVQNWVLKADGIQLGTTLPYNTTDGYLMFSLSPNFVVPAGQSKTISLYGDTWKYSSTTTFTGSVTTGVYFINAFGIVTANNVPVGNLPVWATVQIN